ncbi:MAG TPA: ATP-binding protein, partial [Bryobacteraceae bacterium]|jgi:chemotaxis family two-component system sensor kinase Cph1
MQKLIHDLLQFSRVIHEGDEGSGTANLEAVVERVLEVMRNQIETTGVVITREPLPEVRGDETLLEQVFRNLISNAIKYRKAEESPRIQISAKRNGRSWLIGVTDNGIGFDPQFSERIFTLFQRLHGREYPGTGVGLAICKRVIEQAGGRIWAESSAGAGSTFYFTLDTAEPVGA